MKVLLVTNMYPIPEMPSFGTFVRKQVESLRKQGVDIDVFFVNGRKNVLNYLWAFPRLWIRLLTKRYDLVHAHYVLSGLIARAQFLHPVVLTHHGPEVFRGWQGTVSRLLTPLVDRAIVVSDEMKEKGRLNNSHVIPCGIDFELFSPIPQKQARGELNLPQDKKLVLWAGEYFRPEKRFDIVKASIAQLERRTPDVQLVLVSGKPLSEVPKYMNACDVLLLVSDAEGSPMVIKEAMACNLPIVSVPAGDVPQVIEGTAGCYLCSQDPKDVAEKLEMALRWGQRTNGREKIRHLENGNISRRIISIYDELLQEKKRSGFRRLFRGKEIQVGLK
ncbi:MAG: glycosyltransferase family 4 protein [Dehalococcoidia bacterium]